MISGSRASSRSRRVVRVVVPAGLFLFAVAIAGACSSGNEARRTGAGGTSGSSTGAGPGAGGVGITTTNGAGGSIVTTGGSSGSGGGDGGLKPCQQMTDCRMNELCIDGTCRPIGGSCMSDADCLGD